MSGWNLPPGCNDSDIPGNSPRDEAWDEATEQIESEWAEHCSDHESECDCVLVVREDEDREFQRCLHGITMRSESGAIVLAGSDPDQCPFFEQHVQSKFDDMMDGSDNPDCP